MDTETKKLQAVLARLCEQVGELAMTQAVKLPYLVDVFAERALGRKIVDATYQAWDYGVVAKEAWVLLHYAPGPLFKVEVCQFSEASYVIQLNTEADVPRGVLTSDELEIVDFVAEKYGRLSATALGGLTKIMNPQIETWGSNEEPATGEDAYSRLSDDWNRTRRAILNVDLDDKSKWGGPIGDPGEYVRTALH